MTVNYHIIALIHIFILYLLRLYLPHNAKIYSRIYFGTPPGRTPNGGGYPFSKFFYFLFFYFSDLRLSAVISFAYGFFSVRRVLSRFKRD